MLWQNIRQKLKRTIPSRRWISSMIVRGISDCSSSSRVFTELPELKRANPSGVPGLSFVRATALVRHVRINLFPLQLAVAGILNFDLHARSSSFVRFRKMRHDKRAFHLSVLPRNRRLAARLTKEIHLYGVPTTQQLGTKATQTKGRNLLMYKYAP